MTEALVGFQIQTIGGGEGVEAPLINLQLYEAPPVTITSSGAHIFGHKQGHVSGAFRPRSLPTRAVTGGGGPSGDALLMESGDYILLEDGFRILLDTGEDEEILPENPPEE